MPYSLADRCEKCILANYPEECNKVQCKAEERSDHLTGYFRLYRSSAPIDQPVPKGMALIMMLILFSVSVLFSSCASFNLTIAYNREKRVQRVETPVIPRDSSVVNNMESAWY